MALMVSVRWARSGEFLAYIFCHCQDVIEIKSFGPTGSSLLKNGFLYVESATRETARWRRPHALVLRAVRKNMFNSLISKGLKGYFTIDRLRWPSLYFPVNAPSCNQRM